MGRAKRARLGGAVAVVERGPRCHNEGALIGCEGRAVHLRGRVPLCRFCEDSASSLKRLPKVALRPVDVLADLRRGAQRRRLLDQQLEELVDQALDLGHSYAEVGQALGISRQAVRQAHLRAAGGRAQ